MDCKKALKEKNGDTEAAIVYLKEKGLMDANKREGRSTREGIVSIAFSADRKESVIVELNCETDFVAKNEGYHEVNQEIANTILSDSSVNDTESATKKYESNLKEIISKFGENTTFGKIKKISVKEEGIVESYIHAGSKVGVIVSFGFTKSDTKDNAIFKELSKRYLYANSSN